MQLAAIEHLYTLYTKPFAEYQVANTLKGRGINTYLPENESPKSRQRPKREPFFACYLFVRIDLAVVGLSQPQWTPGLRRIIAFEDQSVPVPDEAVNLIRRKLNGSIAAGGCPAHTFHPGEMVRITDGP